MQKLFSKFFRKWTEFQPIFFSNIKKLPKLFLKWFSNFFFSKNFFYENYFEFFYYRISTEIFFKYKKIAKIIFKIFFEIFFLEKFFLRKFVSNFFFEKFFSRKVFATNFFFCWKFLLWNFFWWKFFFSQKYFCEDCFHNIFANFFCIWCLRNNVFCGILLFVLQFWCMEKKNKKIFFAIFFSATNVNTKFENFSFPKKSKIFSDRTFGFLYSLLRK